MNKTILIVENDHVLLDVYKEILELYNYDVQTASNGIQGVEKFKQIKPSLVVMEGDMPILDGYEAFKQIKGIDKNANVVIVTGDLESESKNQESLDQGLIKVILKPVLVKELLKMAKKYTGIKLDKNSENMEKAMFELTIKTDNFLKKFHEKVISD